MMLPNKPYSYMRYWGTMLVIAITSALIGCNQSPLSSQNKPIYQDANQSEGLYAASTKPTVPGPTFYLRSNSKNFKANQKETLLVNMPSYGNANTVRLKKAILEVPEDALGYAEQITMTCYSCTTVDDIHVVFGPSGLTFKSPARLTLYLQGPVTAEEVMQVEHIYGTGQNVDIIYTEIDQEGEAYLVVAFDVPGFSRYSLGGGY